MSETGHVTDDFGWFQIIDLIQSSAMTGMKVRLWGIDLPCFQWHPL